MEDKTAKIPSLKNFSAQNKQASSERKPRSKSTQSRASSAQDKARRRTDADRKSQPQRTRQSGDRADRRAKTSAPAPRTYARQRQDVSEAIARTQVVNTKGEYPSGNTAGGEYPRETVHKQRTQGTVRRTPEQDRESAQRRTRGTGTPSGAGQQNTARRGSGGNPPSRKGGKPSASKKQKRPISPRARRFRKTVINIGLCLAVIIIGVILSLTVLFKTETITVSGNGNIPKSDIIAASGLNLGENIFTAPKGRAEEKLEKAYPYIQQAQVRSVFPNSISIEITMATPACVIEGLGGYYIVSGEGKVLEVSATDDEIQAPVIEGVNVGGKVAGDFVEYGSSVVGDSLREMFTAFEELGCTEVTAINIATEDDAVEIKYVHDNRIVVYLGIPEHITYKIQTAHTIIKEKIDAGGTMIAGDLDVSMCHDSMKSYFNQYTLLAPNSAYATEPETEPATTEGEEAQPDTQVYYY